MAYTQAQWVADFRDHLGETGSNGWSDYQLITATRRAYEAAWPDFWLPLLDTSTYTRYASVAANTNIIPVPSAFIGGDIFNIYGRVNVYQPGTAIYGTSGSSIFTTTAATGLANDQAVQVDGNNLPGGLATGTTYYIAGINANATQTYLMSAGFSTVTTGGATGWTIYQAVQLGTPPTGFSASTVYYVSAVLSSTTFTLSATPGGAALIAGANGSGTITRVGAQNFNLATNVGGSVVTPTSSGSGYIGALFSDNTFRTFDKLERGLAIDPLALSAPNIRFTQVWGRPYELQIEGSSQLSYPTLTLTTTASSPVIAYSTTDTTFSAVVGDKVYFYASAPGGFTAATPYYIIAPIVAGTSFTLSATSGGGAVTPTTSRTYTAFADNTTLPGTGGEWFPNFLRFQGEVNVTRERQRSGNLDRRAMAQRRLLAQQDVTEARSHRMRAQERTTFRRIG